MRRPVVARGATLTELLIVIAIALIILSMVIIVGRLLWNAVYALKTGATQPSH